MTGYTALLLWLLILPPSIDQKETYICLPCGYDCDKLTHDGPGTCSSCGMELVKSSTIRFKTIDFSDLCKRLEANPNLILLDVRSPEEFGNNNPPVEAFGRFKGAINMNVTQLSDRMEELSRYRNAEVIVYCSHSHRSPRASYLLSTHGFRNVSNLSIGVSYFRTNPIPSCLKDKFIDYPGK
ncbi:MAG TPA: rhodanese-like domain-containing protein [Cyclobacteriaceae bacterium]|nr:rhodanese-like domain-containing protein [Cyclobacteriaceae bacterium]